MHISLIFFLSLCMASIHAEETPVDLDNVPTQVSECLKQFQNHYQISHRMNPFYLRANLDGDGQPDYAVLITELASKKEGIAICFGEKRKETKILGAGVSVAVEGGIKEDDFAAFNIWGIAVGCGTRKHDCLYLEQAEAGSGFFIWNGRRFVWEQGAI
jgi:hypothetical protein